MRVRGAERNPFADLKRVVEPQADGPVVGFYGDHPIAAAVVDQWGHRFVYVGAAPRRFDGQCDYSALGSNEWIVEPGLSMPVIQGAVGTLRQRRAINP